MTDRKLRESDVEARLVKRVAERGGVAEKFKSPNRNHVPDRLVQWPRCDNRCHCSDCEAGVCFVECKRPNEGPTVMQARDHEARRAMGFRVYVVDTYEAVDQFLIAEGYK
jgi:hypothetical protein